MPRREKPAKSNQTTTDPTMIPQWRVPKFRENLPPASQSATASILRTGQSALRADPDPLSGSPAKDTNRIWDASIVTVHGTLGLRPLAQTPVNGNNSRDSGTGLGERNSEKICPRLQREKKNEIIHLEDDAVLGDGV